jgi:hypothetical protein
LAPAERSAAVGLTPRCCGPRISRRSAPDHRPFDLQRRQAGAHDRPSLDGRTEGCPSSRLWDCEPCIVLLYLGSKHSLPSPTY